MYRKPRKEIEKMRTGSQDMHFNCAVPIAKVSMTVDTGIFALVAHCVGCCVTEINADNNCVE